MVSFACNIDCLRRHIGKLNDQYRSDRVGFDGIPIVGDRVLVLREENPPKEVYLKVVQRTWMNSNMVILDLHFDYIWESRGITEFEKWFNGRDE
jgi:hypothetical protein